MIRILCLNPVVDRMYFIDNFTAAELYREIKPQVYVGGKGVNIARVLSLLDEKCNLYGFIGGNNGKIVMEDMKQRGVEFIAFQTEGETRTTINIIDNARRMETEITEPSVVIGQAEEEMLLDKLDSDIEAGDIVICSGIPMKGMSLNIYQKVSNLCRIKNAKCVLDANGDYLTNSFPANYFFIKPNFKELLELLQCQAELTVNNTIELGKKVLDMGVENILISTGENGGIFLNSSTILQAVIPNETVVSTIGSGDSTVAGFCAAFHRGYSTEDCIRYAMACGICNAGFSKVGYVEKAIVDELYKKINIQELK